MKTLSFLPPVGGQNSPERAKDPEKIHLPSEERSNNTTQRVVLSTAGRSVLLRPSLSSARCRLVFPIPSQVGRVLIRVVLTLPADFRLQPVDRPSYFLVIRGQADKWIADRPTDRLIVKR